MTCSLGLKAHNQWCKTDWGDDTVSTPHARGQVNRDFDKGRANANEACNDSTVSTPRARGRMNSETNNCRARVEEINYFR